ncbi:unnamed protein product [Lactuca virosa]|uniref:Uncharacterized protein n=1 Tax=Lactuca virosa TaxID=75947 RepID=A0AAU9NE06_9ASTR|nr:unnamed protein product [Lactuca virosa]
MVKGLAEKTSAVSFQGFSFGKSPGSKSQNHRPSSLAATTKSHSFSSRFHPLSLSLSLSLSALLSCFLFKSQNSNGFDGTNSTVDLSCKISNASTQSLFLAILSNQLARVSGCAWRPLSISGLYSEHSPSSSAWPYL